MKTTFLLLLAAATVGGCATHAPKPVSNNPDLLRVSDEKPVGYPKTFYEHVPNTLMCEEVNQDWRPGAYNGHKVWFREELRKTVNCPASP
jgi:hypothetical protein